MDEFNSCPKCGHQTIEQAVFCQQCGGRMMSSSKARKLGWVAVAAGSFVLVLMACIFYFEMQPTTHFEGSPHLWRYAMTVESLVVVLGIVGLAGGVSQIKHGKRNKALNNIGLTLLSVLMGVIAWEQMNKGD